MRTLQSFHLICALRMGGFGRSGIVADVFDASSISHDVLAKMTTRLHIYSLDTRCTET